MKALKVYLIEDCNGFKGVMGNEISVVGSPAFNSASDIIHNIEYHIQQEVNRRNACNQRVPKELIGESLVKFYIRKPGMDEYVDCVRIKIKNASFFSRVITAIAHTLIFHCPKCGGRVYKYGFDKDTGVQLYKCANCGKIWS